MSAIRRIGLVTAVLGTVVLLPTVGSGIPTPGLIGINTDEFTVVNDGDDDPHLFKGLPFTSAVLPGGLAGFYVVGDLTIADGERLRISGSRGLSLHVAGDFTVAAGAIIDASAQGAVPGPGGGGGAPAPVGGVGGAPSGPLAATQPGYGGGRGGLAASGGHGGTGETCWSQPGGAAGVSGAGSPGSEGLNSPGGGGTAGDGGAAGNGGGPTVVANGGTGGAGGSPLGGSGRSGYPGYDGTDGSGGFPGQPGATGGAGLNTGVGLPISAGGGGGSGGAGGGGGGGTGGAAGGGGGGGGGGAGNLIYYGHAGGLGGAGGAGGVGGRGGQGGSGGAGGAGGGAVEIVVLGRLTVTGSILADGGDGSAPVNAPDGGRQGGAGASGLGGWPGATGSAGNGGRGGDGGDGGDGGTGGDGGAGALGGGGAGGTIRLAALQLDTSGATIRAAGGDGGATGGNGRFLHEPGAPATFGGSAQGIDVIEEHRFRPMDVNPFVVGAPVTPVVPFVAGGPEVYGRAVGIDMSVLDAMLGTPPDWASLAMTLVDSPTDVGIAWEEEGFDVLLLTNVRQCPIRAPRLTIGESVAVTALLERGPARRAEYGGGGSEILGTLEPGATYLTLIPEGQNHFAVTALHRTAWMSAYAPTLVHGTATYVVQPDGVADCTVFVDLDVAMQTPRVNTFHATIPTEDGDVDLDLHLSFDEKGGLATAGECSLGGEGATVTGRVFQKKGVPWFDVKVKCLATKAQARVKAPVEFTGATMAQINYRSHERTRTRAEINAQLGAALVNGNAMLYPEVDDRGRVTGSADLVGGFDNDPAENAELNGRIRGKRLTFQVRAGRQRLKFSGKLDGADFVGKLKVKVPPEKATIRTYRVADPRRFN